MVRLITPAVAYRDRGSYGKYHLSTRSEVYNTIAGDVRFYMACHDSVESDRVDVIEIASLPAGVLCKKCIGVVKEEE